MLINQKYILEYLKKPQLIFRNISMWSNSPKQFEGDFVFVLGPPRSGTTLLQNLILAHSKFDGWPHETSVFSPKNLFNRNRFFYVDDLTYYRCENSNSIVEFFVNLHKKFIDSDSIPVEKTPQHSKRIKTLLSRFPNAKFIYIVRDPRDAYYSGLRGMNIPQCKSAKNYKSYWLKCIKPIIDLESKNLMIVKYEDLTKNPGLTLDIIMNFLGYSLEENQLDPKSREKNPRISEGKAFKKLSAAIDDSSVGRYKELNSDVLKEFEDLEFYIKKLGY